VEIAAIGPATSDALESAGHTVTIIPQDQFNSESMLAHPALMESPGTAVIFAAPGGRQTLFSGLQKMGWEAEFAHVYRAVPLEPTAEAVEAIAQSNGILSVWTSANALRQLSEMLDASVWNLVSQGSCLVTSNRIAKIAGEVFSGQIHVTYGPGNSDIRDCILKLI
jgi:uroporphyrinogen-III synthase